MRQVSSALQKDLEKELESLKHKFDISYELKVIWLSNDSPNLSGR